MASSNEIKALRDKTYCSLSKCKQAFDYAEKHEGCTPEGYLRAIYNGVATPGMSFEDRVKKFSNQ